MPSFVQKDDTKTVQADWWAEKEHAVIRRFGYGVRARLQDAAIKAGLVEGVDGDDEISLQGLAIGNMNLMILQEGIASMTDGDGARVPVTRQNIEALEDQDAEFLLAEINAFNPSQARSETDQESFRDSD